MQSIDLRPRITTVAGGLGLMVGGGIGVILATAVPVFGGLPFPILWELSVVSDLFLLAAAVILALGIFREPGIVGVSPIGKIALVVFGARNLVFLIVGAIPYGPDGFPAAIFLNAGLSVIFAIAAIVAAVFVARARVLSGLARWVLAVVAICYAVITALMLFPVIEIAQFLAAVRVDIVLPVSFVVLGVVYLFQRRIAAKETLGGNREDCATGSVLRPRRPGP